MKATTILNNINTLIEKIEYESAYVEIKTKTNTFIVEKKKVKREIGFKK